MLDHYSRFFSTYIYDSKISLEYDRRCDIMMYLFVTVLRLAWLVVGVLVGVVVGQGHLAETRSSMINDHNPIIIYFHNIKKADQIGVDSTYQAG